MMNKLPVSTSELNCELSKLGDGGLKRHSDALAEGYKDEKCPKCKTIFLAHMHLVRCEHAPHGNCPMVTDTESLLDKLCPENQQ